MRVIDYATVLDEAQRIGLRYVYPNGGAFAFVDAGRARSIGWVGPDDPTIRPEARELTRQVPPPYEPNLARLLVRAWCDVAPASRAWVMPASHWAYELQFGSGAWLPPLLAETGIDPKPLASRSRADAIEFSADEVEPFENLARQLLHSLEESDFTVLFPPHALVCTLHHHKQLWWTTTEDGLIETLRAMV